VTIMTMPTPIGSPARVGQGAAGVRVMGTPRSGTNLAKHLIERYLGVPVVFDHGFWKHGIFPALMSGRDLLYGELPIVVMSKDPVSQVLAWYRLARNDPILAPSSAVLSSSGRILRNRATWNIVSGRHPTTGTNSTLPWTPWGGAALQSISSAMRISFRHRPCHCI